MNVGSIPYPELLAYAQSLSAFTSAPPNMPEMMPGQPPPPLFFPPFPNEEKMRRGRMNNEESLGPLGETHSVGRRKYHASSTTSILRQYHVTMFVSRNEFSTDNLLWSLVFSLVFSLLQVWRLHHQSLLAIPLPAPDPVSIRIGLTIGNRCKYSTSILTSTRISSSTSIHIYSRYKPSIRPIRVLPSITL